MKKREDKWVILNTFSSFIPIGWSCTRRLAKRSSHFSPYCMSPLPTTESHKELRISFIKASSITWVKGIELWETLLASYKKSNVDCILNILPALEKDSISIKRENRTINLSRPMFELYLCSTQLGVCPLIHISEKAASNCGPWERLNKPFQLTVSQSKEVASLSLIYKIYFKRGSVKYLSRRLPRETTK